jgi:hypothetical protein
VTSAAVPTPWVRDAGFGDLGIPLRYYQERDLKDLCRLYGANGAFAPDKKG